MEVIHVTGTRRADDVRIEFEDEDELRDALDCDIDDDSNVDDLFELAEEDDGNPPFVYLTSKRELRWEESRSDAVAALKEAFEEDEGEDDEGLE